MPRLVPGPETTAPPPGSYHEIRTSISGATFVSVLVVGLVRDLEASVCARWLVWRLVCSDKVGCARSLLVAG